MSRTYKDKHTCTWYRGKLGDQEIRWDLNRYTVGWSKQWRQVKRGTNRKLRRHKGGVSSGGWYKKPFCTEWDII